MVCYVLPLQGLHQNGLLCSSITRLTPKWFVMFFHYQGYTKIVCYVLSLQVLHQNGLLCSSITRLTPNGLLCSSITGLTPKWFVMFFNYRAYTNMVCYVLLLPGSDSGQLLLPHKKTEFGKRAFAYGGPHALNDLPMSLRSVTTMCSFKSALKTHLFRCAYSLNWH